MKLTDFQQIYEKYLQENPFKGSPKNLYDPMNYIMGLDYYLTTFWKLY